MMIEGIIITAIANEVHHAFVYIRGEYPKPARRVQAAVDEAYDLGSPRVRTVVQWARQVVGT